MTATGRQIDDIRPSVHGALGGVPALFLLSGTLLLSCP
jgi:hypothetical protein